MCIYMWCCLTAKWKGCRLLKLLKNSFYSTNPAICICNYTGWQNKQFQFELIELPGLVDWVGRLHLQPVMSLNITCPFIYQYFVPLPALLGVPHHKISVFHLLTVFMEKLLQFVGVKVWNNILCQIKETKKIFLCT